MKNPSVVTRRPIAVPVFVRPKREPTNKERIARAWRHATGTTPHVLKFAYPVPPMWRLAVRTVLASRKASGHIRGMDQQHGVLTYPGTWRELAVAMGYSPETAGNLSRRMRRGWTDTRLSGRARAHSFPHAVVISLHFPAPIPA